MPGEASLTRSWTFPLHRFAALGTLTQRDEREIAELGEEPVCHRRGEVIRHEGTRVEGFYLLIEGWVASSLDVGNDRRRIQKLHLPGDILSTPSMVLETAADTLTPLTDCVTSFVSHRALGRLLASNSRLTAMLVMAIQIERLHLMDALASAGQSSAIENMAHLLLDLHNRLQALHSVSENSFHLPVTQETLGEVLGLSAIHVNRTLRAMVAQGLIAMRDRQVTLVDLPRLRSLSPVPLRTIVREPSWLPAADEPGGG